MTSTGWVSKLPNLQQTLSFCRIHVHFHALALFIIFPVMTLMYMWHFGVRATSIATGRERYILPAMNGIRLMISVLITYQSMVCVHTLAMNMLTWRNENSFSWLHGLLRTLISACGCNNCLPVSNRTPFR